MAGKDVGGELPRRRQAGQQRVAEDHEVGLLTDREATQRPARSLRAAGHRRQPQRLGHAGALPIGEHVALALRQALGVFEQAQFLGGVDAGVAVRADAPGAAPGGCVEHAVAEVGLGGRTQADHRTAPTGTGALVFVEVRGMHQAPAGVDRRVVEQPLHRSLAAPGLAVDHFLKLFGDVDVHRRAGVEAVQPGQQLGQRRRCDGAQRVRCDAAAHALRAKQFDDAQQIVDVVDEATLVVARRLRAETALLVKHRQHRQADAGTPRRGDEAQRHLRRVRIGLSGRIVVHVMELADRRVAGAQHLDVQVGRDVFQLVGVEQGGEAVHQVAPGPEAVLLGAAVLGEAGEGALKGV